MLEGPTSAGLIVSSASRGGTFRRVLQQAIGLVQAKASPDEVDGYRRFILALAERVAAAKEEGDEPVSDAERAAIGEVAAAIGAEPA